MWRERLELVERIRRHQSWMQMIRQHGLNTGWFYAEWYEERLKAAEFHLTDLLWKLTSLNYR